jgi:hypothetical protein
MCPSPDEPEAREATLMLHSAVAGLKMGHLLTITSAFEYLLYFYPPQLLNVG